ncbi:GAG-pre-integrase domain - like 6 [Theobroma cacao]|nr:GAG-pre-integrase domain - like 6 [Theobroma cacao]
MKLSKDFLEAYLKIRSQRLTAICKAKDLNVITLDEICGSLLTHELELKEEEEEDKREAKETKKSITLKASIFEEELDSLSCDDDEELAIVVRKFKKFIGQRNQRLAYKGYKRNQSSSWRTKNKNESNKKEELICFECKKPRHFRSECPLLKEETPKKNKKSKKAIVAMTWLDSDTSSSDDKKEKAEERVNLCLMARDDESEVSLTPYDISSDELQEGHECLYDEFEKLASKYKTLKKKTASLEIDLEKIIYDFKFVEQTQKDTCTRAQPKEKEPWYMDSGCSRHMTENEMLFAQLDKKKKGVVSFGDDSKGRIYGIGTIGKNFQALISNVLLVKDLEVKFETCLMANVENDGRLWHRRLGHASMYTISNLIRKNLVISVIPRTLIW